MQVYGLYGHIRANQIRSAILLAGFVLLLQMLQFSIYLLFTAFTQFGPTFETIVGDAFASFKRTWPIASLLALAWFETPGFRTTLSSAWRLARRPSNAGTNPNSTTRWRTFASHVESPCQGSRSWRRLASTPTPPDCARTITS